MLELVGDGPAHTRVRLGPFLGDLDSDLANELGVVRVWTGRFEPPGGPDSCRHPAGQPTVLGEVVAEPPDLFFEPRLPFLSGQAYTACVAREELDRYATETGASFAWPGHAVELADPVMWLVMASTVTEQVVPQVTNVWPSANVVPANLLRFYVTFSEPMQERDVATKVRLVDDQGRVIDDALVPIPGGLWDARSTRLTLFIHPGRIKRGVGPNERLGPVLEAGRAFELVVDGALESRTGVPLGSDVRRRFEVRGSDRTLPDFESWRLSEAPDSTGGNDPVTVVFDEPLDRAQLETAVSVERATSGGTFASVEGQVVVAEDGMSWSFRPKADWSSGRYRVVVSPTIEDLAGNSPFRLFDVETDDVETASASAGSRSPVQERARREIELFFEVSR